MGRNFRMIRLSSFLRSAYLVWALLVISYVFFEILDVDGSNLTRWMAPLHRSALVAEAIDDLAVKRPETNDQRQHEPTPTLEVPQRRLSARPTERLRSETRAFLRAYHYGIGSPRDSTTDSPPDH